MKTTLNPMRPCGANCTLKEKEMFECKCMNWARDNVLLLTKHHPKCPKYNVEAEAKQIIKALIKGIDHWASDEDGVHDACWPAYQSAKFFIKDLEVNQMWSGIQSLDELRSKAAASGTGCISVSIEKLNRVKDEVMNKIENRKIIRQSSRPMFPCGNCGHVLYLELLSLGDRCPSCGCLL